MPTNYGRGRPVHPDAMEPRKAAARDLVGAGPAALRPIRKFPRPDEHTQVVRPIPSEGTPVFHGVKNLRAAQPLPFGQARGVERTKGEAHIVTAKKGDATARVREVRRAKGQEGY